MTPSELAAAKRVQPGLPTPEAVQPDPAPAGTSLGVCVAGEHPTLAGRALVRWRDGDGAVQEGWLPHLKGLLPRRGDRVVLTTLANHDEPIVLGVLDGLRGRLPAPAAVEGPLVRLAPHEALRVAAADGTPLLELTLTEAGPVVRLLVEAADVSIPGKLRLAADELELEARQGEVRVSAAGDVKVQGEVIRLN